MYNKTIEILKEHNIKVISTIDNFDKNNIELECYCGKSYTLSFKKISVLKHKCCKTCFSLKMSLLRSETHRKKNVKDILVDKGFNIICGEYINQNSIFKFKCTSCDEEFDRSAGQALHTTTMCRKCSNYDSSYDGITRINELEKRGVKIINYISKNEIYVKCKICHDATKTSYNKSINGIRCKLCVSAITPISFENIMSKIPSNITWVSGVYRNQKK